MANNAAPADHLLTIPTPSDLAAMPVYRRELYEKCARWAAGPQDESPLSGVYFIQAGSGAIKIGIAANVSRRLVELQVGNHDPLRVLTVLDGGRGAEREYHARFAQHRLRGEWFAPHPDILAEIARLTPPGLIARL